MSVNQVVEYHLHKCDLLYSYMCLPAGMMREL